MEQTIITVEELSARGIGAPEIRQLIRRGTLTRLRRGWYSYLGTPSETATAVRAGAHLGCLSGCRAHGLWVPPFTGVHAAYGRGAVVTPAPGLVLHPYCAKQPRTAIWPVEDCLAQVIARHDRETILIVTESGVNEKAITHEVAESLVSATPHGDLRRWLSRARSGSETRVRLFFQDRKTPVHPLVFIPEIGEVDMVVGDRMLVECDSNRYHGTPEQQAVDHLRDMNAELKGYRRIRLTSSQIWEHWDATQASLTAVLRQRRHIHRLRDSQATTAAGLSRARGIAEAHAQRRRLHSIGYEDDLRDILGA